MFGFLYGASFTLLLTDNIVHNVTYAIVGVGGIFCFVCEVVGVVVLFLLLLLFFIGV